MRRKAVREDVATALRERLRAADQELVTPPDLWERIQTPSLTVPGRAAEPQRPLTRRRSRTVVAIAAMALAVGAIGTGAWWLGRSPGTVPGSTTPASAPPLALTVYNAEAPCRPLRTMECALSLARNPHAPYAAPGNSVGKVWHGDSLAVTCVVTDGTLTEDESGITSARWYLVTTATGTRGWLPGVRTRNTTDIRTCTTAEAQLP